MNRWGLIFLFVLFLLILMSGCKSDHIEVPPVPEELGFEKVKKQDFVKSAPGYGIYSSGTFQVNIEAEDSSSVAVGQKATVQLNSGKEQIACEVTRILRSVTAETKQGIAWLRPVNSAGKNSDLQEGDFVFATITTETLHRALAVPRRAVFVKDSKSWVIKKDTDEKGKEEFNAIEIQVGATSMDAVQVLGGLKENQEIVDDGGIGFLYPDFKAASDE